MFPFLLQTLGFAAAVFAKCDIKGDFTCKLACQPMSLRMSLKTILTAKSGDVICIEPTADLAAAASCSPHIVSVCW